MILTERNVSVTITRPANTTAYTANDVVGGAQELPLFGLADRSTMITDIMLQARITAIPSGMTTFRLHFYSVTPPSALADNAAFDVPTDDQASYLGMVLGITPADLGTTVFGEASGINKIVRQASSSLFFYLVTDGGFTPAANSEVYVVTAQGLAV